jgi:formylglycine-generating enzyme required for sulfatase activity
MKPLTSHISFLLTTVILSFGWNTARAQQDISKIPGGSFHSVLPEIPGEPIKVSPFYLDVTAVTNGEFLKFLENHPEWRKDQVSDLYAGPDYLRHLDITEENSEKSDRPVTRVSWYAANAYCSSQGGRLPTLNEWEYAAQLMDFDSDTEADRFASELIGWYSAVDAVNVNQVGSTGIENEVGVKDMFGLIMEWVEDFNPPISNDISLDCGTVGRMQGDPTVYSYAMSIRYITRMSFKPESTTGMLGFRCAYDQTRGL